jgi:hypothetical protein
MWLCYYVLRVEVCSDASSVGIQNSRSVMLKCERLMDSSLIIHQYLYLSRLLYRLLTVGVPKTFDESKKDLRYIRKAGVRQFISTYNRVKDLKGEELLWGDEIEYGIFQTDPKTKKVRLSLRAKEVSTRSCRCRLSCR